MTSEMTGTRQFSPYLSVNDTKGVLIRSCALTAISACAVTSKAREFFSNAAADEGSLISR